MELKRCLSFLRLNGYIPMYSEESLREGEEYQTFYQEDTDLCSIDINDEEIVFLDGSGDFLHLPCNYYCLLGAMLHYQQLGFGYNRLNLTSV